MTVVSTRERVLRFAPMVEAVQRAGAAIWLQVGHGGLFSMESWHEPYASQRTRPAAGGVEAPAGPAPDLPAGPAPRDDHRRGAGHGRPLRRDRGVGPRGRLRRLPARVEQRQAPRPVPVAVLEPARRRVRRLARSGGPACCASSASGWPSGRARTSRSRSRSRWGRRPRPSRPTPPGTRASSMARLAEDFGYHSVTPGRRLRVPRHDAVARRDPELALEEQGDADPLPDGVAPAQRAGRAHGRLRVRRDHRALPAGVEPQPLHRDQGRRVDPGARRGRHPRRPRGRRDPRRRPGRPRRHRPARSTRSPTCPAASSAAARRRGSASTPTCASPPRCSG